MTDFEYWKNYRKELINKLNSEHKEKVFSTKDEKNKLIYDMAISIGIKATARYFNITPKTVRYWIKKYENKKN